MNAGRVCGTAVCTVKAQGLEGISLLVVQKIEQGRLGGLFIAADATGQAGAGDFVYFVGSKEAARVFRRPRVPLDAAIVGFIDQYNEEMK